MSFVNRVPPISCQSVSWLSVIADLADEEANLDDDDDDGDKEEEEEEGEEEDVFVDEDDETTAAFLERLL